MTVERAAPVILQTAGAELIEVPTTFLEQFLQMLTDPNLVFLLLSVGVQAMLIELSSPGGWVAGFIGVVCITLAVYGLGVLPVNWFGIIFLLSPSCSSSWTSKRPPTAR